MLFVGDSCYKQFLWLLWQIRSISSFLSRLCGADSLEEYVWDCADLQTCTINIAFWLWHSGSQIRMMHGKSMQIRHRLPKHVIRNWLPKGMSQVGECKQMGDIFPFQSNHYNITMMQITFMTSYSQYWQRESSLNSQKHHVRELSV